MLRYKLLIALTGLQVYAFSQNDIDAIRYSRAGVGGSSRFIAMGGAFGAIGGDGSCAAYNPAGLAIYRKGELSFSGALRLSNNTGSLYNNKSSVSDANFAFNNFSFVYAWPSGTDPESRHVIAFTNTQIQNFSSSVHMGGYTRQNSIGSDMANLANQQGNLSTLNNSYEGMGYDTYLLDDGSGHFVSLVDPKRTELQSRDVVTTGRVNELNFSYAYSYKDKFYFGASVGVPRVQYSSTTTHNESDNRDSMRVAFSDSANYTDTYIDGLPSLHAAYINKLGFNNLSYTEYFKTQGTGINLKIGGVVRVNDVLRLGAYYHTPTVYYLNDTYYNNLSVSFDANPTNPQSEQYPANAGGYFEYKIITPSRIGLNAAAIINKVAVVGLDYELVNYRSASLTSTNSADFAGVNSVIKNKYKNGNNFRLGAEFNIKPIMLRAGYSMQGSPYGGVTGDFVRNTVSAGIGFRGKSKWFLDIVFTKSFTTENYFLFTTIDTQARLNYNTTTLGATVGIKF